MTDYKSAGVDTEAGEKAVQLMKADINKTLNKNVLDNFGGFAGLYDISELKNYKHPILTTSTDGVGTKIKIAQSLDIHNTIGIDLVAMVLNDLVVTGSKPLFLTDYIAIGKVIPEKIRAIVEGIANACQQADCALIGGETAEHPGVMQVEDYDLAAAAVGVVEKEDILSKERVKAGDLIYALPSSGLHSNGFSLVRQIIKDQNLNQSPQNFTKSLGETLLVPTNIYVKEILNLKHKLHSVAHITGGGIAANVARVIPNDLHAELDRSKWQLPIIFKFLKTQGNLEILEMERTFNMGLGAALITDQELPIQVIGQIKNRTTETKSDAEPKGGEGGSCSLIGSYKEN
jgi:phosphoribosylformylglycinamidine cyclo-ligase